MIMNLSRRKRYDIYVLTVIYINIYILIDIGIDIYIYR